MRFSFASMEMISMEHIYKLNSAEAISIIKDKIIKNVEIRKIPFSTVQELVLTLKHPESEELTEVIIYVV